MTMTRHLTAALLLLAAGAARGAALGDGVLTVNGFGGWAYGRTSANDYLHGARDGRWDNASFALNVIAQPDERLQVAAQAFFAPPERGASQAHAMLDWAFASWRFSDAFTVRAGKVRQPFGLYGEIRDVGILRPFYSLPQGIYGDACFLGEAFDGAGATGEVALRAGWRLGYDVYGGQLAFDEDIAPEIVAHPEKLAETGGGVTVEERHPSYGGLRLALYTPVDGLSFRLTAAGSRGGHRAGGLSVEWLADPWTLRSEGFYSQDGEDVFAWAGYVELARRLGRVELAARVDTSWTHPTGYRGDSTVMQHRDMAVGVGWWFTPQLVARAALHDVYGNRFAHPDAFDGDPARLALDPRTILVEAGVQFAF